MEHVSIWGIPFPAILNQKNQPGRQEGPKTAKMGVFWYLQKSKGGQFDGEGAAEDGGAR